MAEYAPDLIEAVARVICYPVVGNPDAPMGEVQAPSYDMIGQPIWRRYVPVAVEAINAVAEYDRLRGRSILRGAKDFGGAGNG